MPSQRSFFLTSFFASFRQQAPSLQATAAQANKHSSTTSAASSNPSAAAASPPSPSSSSSPSSPTTRAVSTAAVSGAHAAATANVSIHSPPRGSPGAPMTIPSNRRRGSDSSSEGFRDTLGADKWYIGGRTAAGEERFFKLGVIRRVRSNDGLSLDRLSL